MNEQQVHERPQCGAKCIETYFTGIKHVTGSWTDTDGYIASRDNSSQNIAEIGFIGEAKL